MKLFLKVLFIAILLYAIGHNFKRYNYLTLDGDLPAIVLPVESYRTVLEDPFGMNVLLHDSVYPAPNRFFTHYFLAKYFRNVPIWLQNVFSPLDSVYIAGAIARIIFHFAIVFLIAYYSVYRKRKDNLYFLLAAMACLPFFQIYGFYDWMAIIDRSAVYSFSYALSFCFILLFLLPFFNSYTGRSNYQFSGILKAGLFILLLIISLSGPLNAPVMLLICSTGLLVFYIRNFQKSTSISFKLRLVEAYNAIPSSVRILFVSAIVLGMYSLYIGRNNAENLWTPISLSERYMRLFEGIRYQYASSPAQPLLIAMVIVNSYLTRRLNPDTEALKVLSLLKWFGVLAVVFILLLPLGGYRIYRENIIRFDTVMPITIGLILFYTYFTIYIIRHLENKYRRIIYIVFIFAFSWIYTDANSGMAKFNSCERKALQEIASSTEKVVLVKESCPVMNWEKMKNPEDSRSKAEMLLYWNIISEPKLYYQR